MNKFEDYFMTSGTTLGVFFPAHYLIAAFRNAAAAESLVHGLWNAGFAPSDAIAAEDVASLPLGTPAEQEIIFAVAGQ